MYSVDPELPRAFQIRKQDRPGPRYDIEEMNSWEKVCPFRHSISMDPLPSLSKTTKTSIISKQTW